VSWRFRGRRPPAHSVSAGPRYPRLPGAPEPSRAVAALSSHRPRPGPDPAAVGRPGALREAPRSYSHRGVALGRGPAPPELVLDDPAEPRPGATAPPRPPGSSTGRGRGVVRAGASARGASAPGLVALVHRWGSRPLRRAGPRPSPPSGWGAWEVGAPRPGPGLCAGRPRGASSAWGSSGLSRPLAHGLATGTPRRVRPFTPDRVPPS
jgi:hypothetical protein